MWAASSPSQSPSWQKRHREELACPLQCSRSTALRCRSSSPTPAKQVRRLAVISGAGGSLLAEDAVARGADCLLTGEANHHHATRRKASGALAHRSGPLRYGVPGDGGGGGEAAHGLSGAGSPCERAMPGTPILIYNIREANPAARCPPPTGGVFARTGLRRRRRGKRGNTNGIGCRDTGADGGGAEEPRWLTPKSQNCLSRPATSWSSPCAPVRRLTSPAAVGPERLSASLPDRGELRKPRDAALFLYADAQAPDRRAGCWTCTDGAGRPDRLLRVPVHQRDGRPCAQHSCAPS